MLIIPVVIFCITIATYYNATTVAIMAMTMATMLLLMMLMLLLMLMLMAMLFWALEYHTLILFS